MKEIAAIPNIVYFVRLVDSDHAPAFDFSFHQFVAIYSAHFRLQPETVYIHTNVEDHVVKKILENTTNLYILAINKLPKVKFNYDAAPNKTLSGLDITLLPHRSDFVRTDVLENSGGIYLDDDDVYVLRDLRALSRLGFENIISKQKHGKICNAVIMATPQNKMMQAYQILQDVVLDGGWETASVDLLTRLAQEFHDMPDQVMVMPQDTFFALWADLETLCQVHLNAGDFGTNNHSVENITDFTRQFDLRPPKTWRRDWRPSYLLHG